MIDPCRLQLPLRHLVVMCSLPFLGGSAVAAEMPNVVILLCDDLGYGNLNCLAHPKILTPHLDKLAAEGIKFTHCYSASPVCSPSRAGLLSGRIPNRLGIRDQWSKAVKSPGSCECSVIAGSHLVGYAMQSRPLVGAVSYHCVRSASVFADF